MERPFSVVADRLSAIRGPNLFIVNCSFFIVHFFLSSPAPDFGGRHRSVWHPSLDSAILRFGSGSYDEG
jgi:hypothetical protein